MEQTSVGERKMRSALINTLLQLNEDKKYDIAVSLAADIGYKLVQIEHDTIIIEIKEHGQFVRLVEKAESKNELDN